MTGELMFAICFIFGAMIGVYICTFFELGGHKALADTIVRLINSRNRKKKDI